VPYTFNEIGLLLIKKKKKITDVKVFASWKENLFILRNAKPDGKRDLLGVRNVKFNGEFLFALCGQSSVGGVIT
jgi:hypothetical protein